MKIFLDKKKGLIIGAGLILMAAVYQNCALNSGYQPVQTVAKSLIGVSQTSDSGGPVIVPPVDTLQVLKISVGVSHVCEYVSTETNEDRLRCRGDNDYGQLGLGTTGGTNQSGYVSGVGTIVQISLGNQHSCVLNNLNRVYCWGRNDQGQISINGNAIVNQPMRVFDNAAKVVAGFDRTCVVSTAGTVSCWGDNRYGQSVFAGPRNVLTPTVVTGISGVENLALGFAHTCAITQSKRVYCWGDNSNGQLAKTASSANMEPTEVLGLNTPITLYAGHFHTCTINSDTRVQCWGLNNHFQVGRALVLSALTLAPNDETPEIISTPTVKENIIGAKQLVLGNGHSCALVDPDNSVRCWGMVPQYLEQASQAADRLDPETYLQLADAHSIAGQHGRFCAAWVSGGSGCYYISLLETIPAYTPLNLTRTLATHVQLRPLATKPANIVGTPQLTFAVEPELPIGLHLNPATGVITGTPSETQAVRSYRISIKHELMLVAQTLLNASVITGYELRYPNMRDLAVNVPVPDDVKVVVYGGPAGSQFSVSPALPVGLTLNPNTGVISGTPSLNTPTREYYVSASFNGLEVGLARLNFGVLNNQTLEYENSLYTFNVNEMLMISPRSPTSLIGATIGVTPSLPQGLMSAGMGTITGTPTIASPNGQPVSYTIVASRPGYVTASATIQILIVNETTLTYPATLGLLVVGRPMTPVSPTYSGDSGASFSVTAGSLPAGLVMNANTGVISGTPTTPQNSSSFTVTVSKPGYRAISRDISAEVLANQTLAYNSVSFVVVKSQAANIPAPVYSAGNGGAQFSVSPTLPAGLSIDSSTGVISGTPTAEGPSALYTITAHKVVSPAVAPASTSIQLQVVLPQSLTYNLAEEIVIGRAMTPLNPIYMGSPGTKTFSVSPNLPAGLSINASTGVISGTPSSVQAATNYTISVVSPGFATIQTQISIAVLKAASLTYPAVGILVAGQPMNVASPNYSDGAGATFSVSPGLPAGLTLNTTNGQISGTPSAGSPSQSYQISARKPGVATARTSVSIEVIGSASLSYPNIPSAALEQNFPWMPPTYNGPTGSTFSITQGVLPPGINLDRNTGIIYGKPSHFSSELFEVTASINGYPVARTNGFITVMRANNWLVNGDFQNGTTSNWSRFGDALPFLTNWGVRISNSNARLYFSCANDASRDCNSNSVYQDTYVIPWGSEAMLQASADLTAPAGVTGTLAIHLYNSSGTKVGTKTLSVTMDSSGQAHVALALLWNYTNVPITRVRYEFSVNGRSEYSLDNAFLSMVPTTATLPWNNGSGTPGGGEREN